MNINKNHSLQQMLSVILISFTVISCVTINIYFPAAAAEKVAEQIVNDVLQSGEPDANEDKKVIENENNQSQLNSSPIEQIAQFSSHSLSTLVDFIIPVAEAGQANISIDSPKIRSIRKSMEKRQSKLRPYYASGAVGFTNNGLIASVSNKGLSVKQKSTVKKLIRSENKDRQSLYAEIANANGHPEWKADIQKTFSKTWINKISSGWMYQVPSGQWKRK
ncbi:MAG: YdbL family protein [Gammaproteobacteria bacterium]|nr:YdbL family protein [Gammaproteobacteria bacterium]